jgi:hypothetical protein
MPNAKRAVFVCDENGNLDEFLSDACKCFIQQLGDVMSTGATHVLNMHIASCLEDDAGIPQEMGDESIWLALGPDKDGSAYARIKQFIADMSDDEHSPNQ